MDNTQPDPRAVRLAVAIKRLRARLQEAAPASSLGLSLSEVSILRHLRLEGPMTAASLAAAEHVSQQAIAQILGSLRGAGLVEATDDPSDRRKRLISMTASGNSLLDAVSTSRNVWLTSAIETTIADDELPALDKTIELLERLADAQT